VLVVGVDSNYGADSVLVVGVDSYFDADFAGY
jgi:hypothetical protein